MAAKEKQSELGGSTDPPAVAENHQEIYDRKFKEMQKYIPFLETMIQKLERSNDKSREAQLQKMKSLLSILSNTKKKLKIETLTRCEDVLQKLHEKVEKGSASQQKIANSNTNSAKVKKMDKPVESVKSLTPADDSQDVTNEQHVTSSTDDNPVAKILKTLKMAAVRSGNKNVSSTTLSPAHNSEDSKDDIPSTTSNSSVDSNNIKCTSKTLDNLEQSREKLKKFMGQHVFSPERKSDINFASSSERQYQREPLWENESDGNFYSRDALDKYNSDPRLREDPRKLDNLSMSMKDYRMQYSDKWSSPVDERLYKITGKYDETHVGWSDYKPSSSRQSWHPEGDRYVNIGSNFGANTNRPVVSPPTVGPKSNANQPMLSPPTVGPKSNANQPMLSPTSLGQNFGPKTNKPLLSPTSVGPNYGPNINKSISQISVGSNYGPNINKSISQISVGSNYGPNSNKPMLSPTSIGQTFGLNSSKSMLSPSSPVQNLHTTSLGHQSFGMNSPPSVKRQASQNIPPLYNVLQHPPVAGSKPLSDADIEELMEDTVKTKPDKETKKEESPHKTLRAKLEQEIQQVHKVGISKGGALRNLVQKDDKLKSPTRGKVDFVKPPTEMRKDKSPTSTGVNSDKQKLNTIDKNVGKLESGGPKGGLLNVSTRESKPTDPRKRVPYSPRGEEECRSIKWDNIEPPNFNSSDKGETNFKPSMDTIRDSSSLNTETSQDKSHENAKKDGSSILSSLSKEELQKIVEENLRNLPSPPPNTKEILETVGMNSPAITAKPAWHSSPEIMSPLSPKEYNHGLPRNPAAFNSNIGTARSVLLPTPELPHDPRTHARNQIHDPRLSLKDSQVQGIIQHSVINDPRLNSRHQSQENYRFSSHDQFMRHTFNMGSQASFFSNQSSQQWAGTPCYGVLSHGQQRLVEEGYMHPSDSFTHHTQGFQGHSTNQHEFGQFQGQVHSTHDSFATGHQQPPSWQSQHSFVSGHSVSFHPSQAGQHHMERTHMLGKGQVDPRLCGSSNIADSRLSNTSAMSSQFGGHRSTMPNTGPMQNTNSTGSNTQIRGPGSLVRPSSIEGRPGNVSSERDPRRRSIEESEKLDITVRGIKDNRDVKNSREIKDNRENRKVTSNSWTANSGRTMDRQRPKDRRKDSDPRRHEGSSGIKRNKSPEPKKGKQTELVSPLNSLYGVTIIPKTGKGYGFQKFRIPKIRRPSPPPPPSPPPSVPSKESSESKLESQTDIVAEDQHIKEMSKTKSNVDSRKDKTSVDSVSSKSENLEGCDLEGDKNTEARSKESVTQEWIEGLIRKSFESGEGKKFIEQAKLLEKLGESLKGRKLRKIKQILESDSESESDGSVSESSKKKDSKSNYKDKLNEDDDDDDDDDIPIEHNKKSKTRKLIESDDDHSTDSEPLAIKLEKRENSSETDKKSGNVKEENSKKEEEAICRNGKENALIETQVEPIKKYSKRRSALELLQEDIREMFICEGVVTATGHRMCRLLKETRPGMTDDEILAAEGSYESSVASKKHDKKQTKDADSNKKGKGSKQEKKQKAKVKLKDEEIVSGSEKTTESLFEVDEQLTNVRINKKDDNALDDSGERSSSPVTKPRKKYEKTKWKGYVIEESEDSQDETTAYKDESGKEESEFESFAPVSTSSRSRKAKFELKDSGDEYEGKEHGRRTRFPRVVLEKADISKLNVLPKSRAKYFENSSSDESRERSTSPVNISKSRKLQKSKRGRQSSAIRGRRGGGTARRGRKKRSKSERSGEVSTDGESVTSGHSSIAGSLPQITDWSSPYITSGFTFRRKYTRKGSKFLGKKIGDIIVKLTKRSNDSESSSADTSNVDAKDSLVDKNICSDEKSFHELKEVEDAKLSISEVFSESDNVHCNTESESQLLNKKKNGRILLNLVKSSGTQKKFKKKKTRWQLGIINQSRKKSSLKSKTVESKVKSTEHVLKQDLKELGNENVTESESMNIKDNDDNINQDNVVSENRIDVESKLKQANENMETGEAVKDLMKPEDSQMSDDRVSQEKGLSNDKDKDDIPSTHSSDTLIDKGYILDGSAKYQCKLCSSQYKNIVSHYRNNHSTSEVLISRLPQEEATQAIAEALENNFEKENSDDGILKTDKKRRIEPGEFICRICNHTAAFPLSFYEHISSHTGEYRFRCGKCSTESVTRISLKGHFYHHHPELRGIESFKPVILSQGPSKDAKVLLGYLCSSCNFVQLIKENTEKHISRRHSLEDGVKVVCINMSKLVTESKLKNVNSESERMEDSKEDIEPSESKILGEESKKVESSSSVNAELNSNEMIEKSVSKDENGPEEVSNNDKDTEILKDFIDKEKDDTNSTPMEIDDKESGKTVIKKSKPESESELLKTDENIQGGIVEENLEKGVTESEMVNTENNNKNSECTNAQDNRNEVRDENKVVSEDTAVPLESSAPITNEPPKEIDLKAFVCSDDYEEENSVIQMERLKKMEEIAKDLKDIHPKLLEPSKSSIIDKLSDKLKTGFLNTLNKEKEDEIVNNNTTDSAKSDENIPDASTLIDEKRAIEAAQAVQNLLRAEKEASSDELVVNSEDRSADSSSASKCGKLTKAQANDVVERRVTRSLSRNEEEGESDEESSSDISFDFDADDNEDAPESESHSPDILITATLSALKDVNSGKSSSRMHDIIERLVSKVTKTEPLDETESVDRQETVKHPESIGQLQSEVQPEQTEVSKITESNICAHEDPKSVKPNEQASKENSNVENVKSSDTASNVIGKPPPLMSLGEFREKNLLRNAVVSDITTTSSPIRVGPLEVKRFSDGLLYSCCVRGCFFASTNRMLFAMHLENTHKLSRWDGSCKNCNVYTVEVQGQYKLSQALSHLITYHLVATPDDPTSSTKEVEGKSEIDSNKSEMIADKSEMDGIKSAVDEKKSESSLENSSEGEGKLINKEKIEEPPAPRKFIRLRRLSGDLLSVPKPSPKEDVQKPSSGLDDSVLVSNLPPVETTPETDEQEGSTTNEDENGPFLRIESVVSLNPEALLTDDVHDILKAVEDPNSSKSPEKSDSMECSSDITFTASPKSIFTTPPLSLSSTKSIDTSIPIMTSSPKSYLKASDMQLKMVRGKLLRSHGSVQMIPVTPISKSSSITLLPGQQMSPVTLGNVQLSPVKLHNLKSIDLAHKSNIPHSLVSLAKITRPASSKGNITVSKERLGGGGLWQGQVLPTILPKTTTYVRVEIKDNKVTTKQVQLGTTTTSSILLPSTSPLPMATKALHTLPLTAANVPSMIQVPIPSAPVETEVEAAVSSDVVPYVSPTPTPTTSCSTPPPPVSTLAPTRGPRSKNNVVTPPPVPSTPASSTFLSTTVPKSKIPHKSAVAPSYAKASKVPAVYLEMIKPGKLRHLYKCMARYCSYSTDSEADYSVHYNEHERKIGLKGTNEKKKKRQVTSLKLSEWQQCAYCCAMYTALDKILEHIKMEHGHCLFQCAYCFYRAVSKSYVILHQNTSHISEHVAVLKCKDSENLPAPQEIVAPRNYTIVPYVCGQGSCGAVFYVPGNFTRHLEKEHSQLTIYTCHICGNKSFKPERLLAHYKLHSCCYYQCRYCLHGTDTKEEMHHHLCNFHSNQKANVIIRLSDVPEDGNTQQVLESLKVLDLDEYMADDNALILPPPDDDPTPEDPSVCMNQLDPAFSSDAETMVSPNTDEDPFSRINLEKPPSNEEILNAVSTISDGDKQNTSVLSDAGNENDENGKSDANQNPDNSKDATPKEGKESTAASNERNDDDVVILDDENEVTSDTSKTVQQSQSGSSLGSTDEKDVSQDKSKSTSDTMRSHNPQTNSTVTDSDDIQEINIISSDKDSDIECLGETRVRKLSKLNESQDSDVILLDNTSGSCDSVDISKKTKKGNENRASLVQNALNSDEPMVTLKHRNPKTVAEIESAVDPLSSVNETTEKSDTFDESSDPRIIKPNELIFSEPMVTLKHRDPKRSAEIQMAVDPLSLDDDGNSRTIGQSNAEAEGISDSGEAKQELKQGELSGTGMESTLEEEETDTGLTGSMLYRCGYVTCTFSAGDSSLLKDHLLVCDLARDSSSLNCVHCKKQFKQATSLLEHLRTHGTKRFECGLCKFRAPVPQQVAKHLKQRHRVSSTRVVPLNPLKSDPETATFVVFPKDRGKGARGCKTSGKDGHDIRNKSIFLPEEVDILPRQAIYTKPVRCATCSYTTKVRSNMVRHLQLHVSSNVPDVIPPNNAPVNPVPCLEKKEMMFDKMTNLAASSHIAASAKAETPSGSLTLTQELEAKLPKFVPEHQRYVCGAPGCSYLTCDETMLRYHLRALHFDETAYRCPHCHETASVDSGGQVISVERMGAHLKMHDSRLYKCAHCIYHHFQRHVVERHLADKHPEKRPFVHVVREPEMEVASSKAEAAASEPTEPVMINHSEVIFNTGEMRKESDGNENHHRDLSGTKEKDKRPSGTAGANKNPWHCGLCCYQCATRSDVLDHTWNVHGLKSQFKCSLCSYRSSSKHGFDTHFASKHPSSSNVELVHVYRRVDVPSSPPSTGVKGGGVGQENVTFDTTPLWRRDMQRIRHIRGILLEEEGDVPKPDIVHRPSIEEIEEDEDVELEKKEEKEEEDEPRGLFGPYGKPFGGIYYFCTLCNKYRSKFKADFRDHLFRELKYHKWVCTHCRLMSCSRSALQKHSAKVHERDRKPEAIAPLTPNKDIEEWVDKVISTQLELMKSEQQASLEAACKTAGATSGSLSQPGPSGLSNKYGKSTTAETTPGPSNKRPSILKTSYNDSDDDDIIIISDRENGDLKNAAATEVENKGETGDGSSLYTNVSPNTGKLLRYPCKHCKMRFSLIRGLKCHIRHIHLKSKLWTCDHCQFVAKAELDVLKHTELQHPDVPVKYSPSTKASDIKLDDEFWEREYGLGPGSDHNQLLPSSSPTGSPFKKRPRPNSPELTDENSSTSSVMDLAEEGYNKCLYCNYHSRNQTDLKYHMMRHWAQKPLKCGHCEFEGVREYEIKKHSLKAHPMKKVYVIEKELPSEPEIRPLQRTKRLKHERDVSPSEAAQSKDLNSEEMTSADDEPKKETEENSREESRITSEVPNIFRCFYCPQRGTSVVSIHHHWQEKHKNKTVGSNGVVRPGLPFKYKEVNIKQFLKGQDGAAGRKPTLLCAYCKFRGSLTALEMHQRTDHPDKPFQANQALFTRYECAECHFTAFTVNTLKRHFDLEHQGKELQYLVKNTKEDVSGIKDSSKEQPGPMVRASKPLPVPVVTAKYMCLWCQETCESEEKIQVHHALCHSHLQLKYSVEKSSTPTPPLSVSTKKYGCPVCTFSSDTRQIVFEHLYYHAKPYRCGYCIKTFEVPAKVRNHIFVSHQEQEFRMLHLEDVERELAKWRGEIIIREGSESKELASLQKREYESFDLSSSKKLCVARKSTTMSPRARFHAVARKSTNPLPWQSVKKSVSVESGDTSPPSSRSESPASLQEYSFYGCRPSPVDKNRITASVKLRNNLGVNMNMSLATMERFTNMYPVVRLKDLKYEKWMSL